MIVSVFADASGRYELCPYNCPKPCIYSGSQNRATETEGARESCGGLFKLIIPPLLTRGLAALIVAQT